MDENSPVNDVLNLIGLQMADHVPVDRSGDLLLLATELLNVILSEFQLAGLPEVFYVRQRLPTLSQAARIRCLTWPRFSVNNCFLAAS